MAPYRVPLAIYIEGERIIVGEAEVDGNRITAYIDETEDEGLEALLGGREIPAISMAFELPSRLEFANGYYPR